MEKKINYNSPVHVNIFMCPACYSTSDVILKKTKAGNHHFKCTSCRCRGFTQLEIAYCKLKFLQNCVVSYFNHDTTGLVGVQELIRKQPKISRVIENSPPGVIKENVYLCPFCFSKSTKLGKCKGRGKGEYFTCSGCSSRLFFNAETAIPAFLKNEEIIRGIAGDLKTASVMSNQIGE